MCGGDVTPALIIALLVNATLTTLGLRTIFMCLDTGISRISSIKYSLSCQSFFIYLFYYHTLRFFVVESIEQQKEKHESFDGGWVKCVQWKPGGTSSHTNEKLVRLEHNLWCDGNSFRVFGESIEIISVYRDGKQARRVKSFGSNRLNDCLYTWIVLYMKARGSPAR